MSSQQKKKERKKEKTDFSEIDRGVSRWMARSFFYPTLYWTMLKAKVSQTNPWLNVIDNQVILGALPRGRAKELADMVRTREKREREMGEKLMFWFVGIGSGIGDQYM